MTLRESILRDSGILSEMSMHYKQDVPVELSGNGWRCNIYNKHDDLDIHNFTNSDLFYYIMGSFPDSFLKDENKNYVEVSYKDEKKAEHKVVFKGDLAKRIEARFNAFIEK